MGHVSVVEINEVCKFHMNEWTSRMQVQLCTAVSHLQNGMVCKVMYIVSVRTENRTHQEVLVGVDQ